MNASAEVPATRWGWGWLPALVLLGSGLAAGAYAVAAGMPLATGGLAAVVLVAVFLAITHHDGATLLGVYAAVLLIVPSRLVLGSLGGAGTPVVLLGLGLGALWLSGALVPSMRLSLRGSPVRFATVAFLAAAMVSYAAAFLRPIDMLETNAADRGLVVALSSVGVALFTCDVLRDRARLDGVVRSIVIAGTALALIGIVQFTTGVDLAAFVRVPGLVSMDTASAIASRSNFRRVSGTTTHGIEFGVVLGMLLPLALHLAMYDRHRWRKGWWASVLAIGVAVPMSVSRSGAVAVGGVLAVMVLCWPKARRRKVAYGLAAYAVAMKVVFPGLLGTIRALFFSAGDDYSVTSRTEDYSYVERFFGEQPLVGRGIGTFIPTRYDFLDNQYLVTLVEGGLVGMLAYAALWAAGLATALWARRRFEATDDRHLAAAVAAALTVPLLTSATYDFLGFGTGRGLAFLVLGLAGAVYKFSRHAATAPCPEVVATPLRLDARPLRVDAGHQRGE